MMVPVPVQSGIAYLLGSLKGAALAWANAVWERQSYTDFTQEIRFLTIPSKAKMQPSVFSPSTSTHTVWPLSPLSSGLLLPRVDGMMKLF